MRWLARFLWVFVLAVVSVWGCNEVTTPSMAPLVLEVRGFDVEWNQVLLEGVQVCEADTTNCVTTNAIGEATLQLPIGRESSYTLRREEYGSYLVPEVMPAGGKQYWIGMRSDEHLKQQFDRVMSPYPMRSTGRLLLELSPEFAGATFELVTATGKAYYYDEERRWSLDLTETTSWGWGGFVEVSPGVFEVRVIYGGRAQNCVPSPVGWPGTVPDRIKFPVLEGFTTTVDIVCPLP